MQTEPIAIPGAIMSVVVAGFGLAVLLGAPLSPEQVGGIVTFAGAVIGLVTAWQRSRATPNTAVVERIEDGTVIAGEGSELPTGLPIREAGSIDAEVTDIGGYDGLPDQPRRAEEGL